MAFGLRGSRPGRPAPQVRRLASGPALPERRPALRHTHDQNLTGSLLFKGAAADLEKLSSFAREHRLFELRDACTSPVPFSKDLGDRLQGFSKRIRDVSGGEFDLPSLVFLALTANGIYQVARGNVTAPPWYTAFWYAMGIFSKNLASPTSGPDLT